MVRAALVKEVTVLTNIKPSGKHYGKVENICSHHFTVLQIHQEILNMFIYRVIQRGTDNRGLVEAEENNAVECINPECTKLQNLSRKLCSKDGVFLHNFI